jgi:hypothetical protein
MSIMKNLIAFILLLFSNILYSQSFLGNVTKQVNLRQGPGAEFKVISSLPQGTYLFIVSLKLSNDFYNVIDIEHDLEGYVHKSYVQVGNEIQKNDSGFFTPAARTAEYNPSIEIFNNTDLTLTLKLNDQAYSFASQEKRKIKMQPGTCAYRASAPGVMPNYGNEFMQSNQDYTWEFYIITESR